MSQEIWLMLEWKLRWYRELKQVRQTQHKIFESEFLNGLNILTRSITVVLPVSYLGDILDGAMIQPNKVLWIDVDIRRTIQRQMWCRCSWPVYNAPTNSNRAAYDKSIRISENDRRFALLQWSWSCRISGRQKRRFDAEYFRERWKALPWYGCVKENHWWSGKSCYSVKIIFGITDTFKDPNESRCTSNRLLFWWSTLRGR